MSTRTYSQVYADVEALIGDSLATEEAARIKVLINRRARKAYDETAWWPRFLVAAEERQISSAGLMSDTESGKGTIDTLLRLHNKDPYKGEYANEYVSWHAHASGYQVTGYTAADFSNTDAFTISGVLVPDAAATTVLRTNAGTTPAYYSNVSDTLASADHVDLYDALSSWQILVYESGSITGIWTSGTYPASPADVAAVDWAPSGGAAGNPTVTAATLYGIYATYKKALTDTYGTGTGETTDVPGEWADYIVQGAYADWLRSEGQQEKAVVAEAEAEDYLSKQLDKISRQNGSDMFTRITTYSNTQYRT